MDYPELSGATISERDKAFAQEFANFVNGSMCSPDQIGRELTRAPNVTRLLPKSSPTL